MRATGCLLALALLAGCAPAPAAPLPKQAATTLTPLAAASVNCELPGEDADDLRAADAPTAWRSLWVDEDRGSLGLLAAASDGSLWSTYTSEREEDRAVVREDGGVRRWDGSRWETFRIPRARPQHPQSDVAIAAASAGQAWMFGVSDGRTPQDTAGYAATFEGGAWQAEPLAEPAARSVGWGLTAALAVEGEAWAVNGGAAVSGTRQRWRQHTLPAAAGALGYADGALWAVSGADLAPAAMRWQDGAWRQITTPAFPAAEDVWQPRTTLTDVVVIGADDVWAVGGVSWLADGEYDEDNEPLEKGHPLALHWDGTAWTCHWGPATSALDRIIRFSQAEPDGRGGLWVVGRDDLLWHLDGRRWTRHQVPAPPGAQPRIASLAWRPGSREVYAAGSVVSRGAGSSEISHAALWRA